MASRGHRAAPHDIAGVLLDVDGTLVDSVDAHTRAWIAALAEAGYDVPYERVRHLIGMGGDRLLPLVTGIREESKAGAQIAQRRSEIFLGDEAPHLRPTRGAREFIEALRGSGTRIGVASSAKPDELRVLLEVVDATDLMGAAASADDVESSKPAPDVIEAALERVGLAPGEVVLIGDTAYDIESALRAGVATIALRSGGWSDQDLDGAAAIFDDPADLLQRLYESPLAPIAPAIDRRDRGRSAAAR